MNIPNGKGQSLETMSEVVKNFASESDKDLKVIEKSNAPQNDIKLSIVPTCLTSRSWLMNSKSAILYRFETRSTLFVISQKINLEHDNFGYFQVIFEVLFGHKRVKLNDVRKHLRKWNGWDVDPDSQEHHELQEGIGSVSSR